MYTKSTILNRFVLSTLREFSYSLAVEGSRLDRCVIVNCRTCFKPRY